MQTIEMLEAENARLRKWVCDLQSGMYVSCVYCGHRYGPQDKVPATMAEALKQHIAICQDHPMSGLMRGCRAAAYALRSLLAVREGLTDEFIVDLIGHLDAATTKAGYLPTGSAVAGTTQTHP
jgi:hypothetical protein